MIKELRYYWVVEWKDEEGFWRAAPEYPPFEVRREARKARDRLMVRPLRGTLPALRRKGLPTWRPPRGSKLRIRKFERAKR